MRLMCALQNSGGETVTGISVNRIKEGFPTLINTGDAYLDSAASSQAARQVLDTA